LLCCGCGKKAPPPVRPISDEPTVKVVKPQRRDLAIPVGQPSFIESYEQTAIYAKLAGFIEKWNVDIGDRVKKGDVLATIYIPELLQEHAQKKAQVEVDRSLVDQAVKLVEVADENLKAAIATVKEARATVGKYTALVKRWQSEVDRETKLVADGVVDKQILAESRRQLESSQASESAATAAVATAEATRLAKQADLDKSKVDVAVAKARAKVSDADEKRLSALVGYTKLTAPFDGVIVLRNANTGDFVLPAMGDPSASPRSADQSTSKGAPIYVVARTDVVRVYVDVPEQDANFIVSKVDGQAEASRPPTKATVRVSAFGDKEMPAEVTRTSWALNAKSRTLRTEIDLPNPGAKLLPGMYAYGKITIERKGVRVLPRSAVVELGDETCVYLLRDGKAARTPVQTRSGDADWVEVTNLQVGGRWAEVTGDEEVIDGDLSELSDGKAVKLEK
jgi:multidrug efflux pump subunit AcrA (membrane-fusion protein)